VNFVNVEEVKDFLSELDLDATNEEEPELYNTALVLLSALVCGPDTGRLAVFTGLACSFVSSIRRRMIQAELWTDTNVCYDEWFVADGVLCTSCFWLDVLVAEGLVSRAWDEEMGQYCYKYEPDYARRVN
jgi:hypothetical protein